MKESPLKWKKKKEKEKEGHQPVWMRDLRKWKNPYGEQIAASIGQLRSHLWKCVEVGVHYWKKEWSAIRLQLMKAKGLAKFALSLVLPFPWYLTKFISVVQIAAYVLDRLNNIGKGRSGWIHPTLQVPTLRTIFPCQTKFSIVINDLIRSHACR